MMSSFIDNRAMTLPASIVCVSPSANSRLHEEKILQPIERCAAGVAVERDLPGLLRHNHLRPFGDGQDVALLIVGSVGSEPDIRPFENVISPGARAMLSFWLKVA